jgi:branched-chain amino acid transport system ATP-binding protein
MMMSSCALELSSVSRQFGALKAIDDVSFRVQAGERYAVLGSNGAGKTTLFNTISGDVPPSGGRIILFGEDITYQPAHERIRRGLRRTYQSSQLFAGLTVRQSVFLAVQGIASGRFSFRRAGANSAATLGVDAILEQVQMRQLADVPASSLSHGQQRQLEIGMALAGAPRLILFDEPAAGLSPAERNDLTAILENLPRHIGFVIIEHDLEIALRVAQRVTVMHNGKVLMHGTPDEVENDVRVQATYLGELQHG